MLWDKLDPGFLAPVWLFVGLLAVAAVILLELGTRRRRREILRDFGSSQLVAALTAGVSSGKRLLKAVLIIASVALVCIALARPHLLYDWQEERRSGLDILLAVDCSKSMLTPDVKPNRIERAKLAVSDFAEHLPDNRLGLIAFAGDSFLECPLTLDHGAFLDAVRDLDTDTIPRPGTDIATAIDNAVDALHSQPANMKFLILVTDGEDLEGRALEAAKNAAQAGLKIYTVGVGTPNGSTIPEQDEMGAIQYHHDANGQQVVSRLDENMLRQIAQTTGGAYVPLGQRGEGLDEIYDRYIAPLPKQNLQERRQKIPIERYEWPLGLAVLFLIGEFLVNDRVRKTEPSLPAMPVRPLSRRRARTEAAAAPVALALGLLLFGAGVPARAATTDAAERDYKSGNYPDAAENYRNAAESQPSRDDLQYNYGDAAYKAGNYTEAEEAFRKSLETPDLNLQEKAYYNLGNAQFQHGESLEKVDSGKTMELWEKALHSYDSALKLHDAADTQHNYDVVKRKLEELKKQQQQQQQQNQNNSQQNQQQNQNGQNQQQDQNQGSQGQQQQNQPGKSQQNGGQNQQQQQQGNQGQQQQNQNGSGDKNSDKNGNQNLKTYSGTRAQDKVDPQIRSRQDAENLLDSLKDDEKHITARAINGEDNQPPPTASGKDW